MKHFEHFYLPSDFLVKHKLLIALLTSFFSFLFFFFFLDFELTNLIEQIQKKNK